MSVPVVPAPIAKIAIVIERDLARTTVLSPTEEAAILVTA
jgi:hypothetical protein